MPLMTGARIKGPVRSAGKMQPLTVTNIGKHVTGENRGKSQSNEPIPSTWKHGASHSMGKRAPGDKGWKNMCKRLQVRGGALDFWEGFVLLKKKISCKKTCTKNKFMHTTTTENIYNAHSISRKKAYYTEKNYHVQFVYTHASSRKNFLVHEGVKNIFKPIPNHPPSPGKSNGPTRTTPLQNII